MERNGFFFRAEDGRWWSPVGVDGQDATGDPSLDYAPDGEPLAFGKVTATKITRGYVSESCREYASLSSARAAARRLLAKLEKAETEAEFNATIDAWRDRN